MCQPRDNAGQDSQLPGRPLQESPHQQEQAKVQEVKEQLCLEITCLEDKNRESHNQQQIKGLKPGEELAKDECQSRQQAKRQNEIDIFAALEEGFIRHTWTIEQRLN